MKTPAGTECRHYYQDFHRGANKQECRLAKANPNSLPWSPGDCARCAVPAILLANASPDLELTLEIKNKFLIFGKENVVTARCGKHNLTLSDPIVGCPKCAAERPGLEIFWKALEEPEPDSNSGEGENRG
jgi:hypothetical protein